MGLYHSPEDQHQLQLNYLPAEQSGEWFDCK